MKDENEVAEDVTYQILKDPHVDRFFAYDIEVDENGLITDDDGNLLGAVVHFDQYPDHSTLTSIFDDLLVRATMCTQEVDANDAREMIDACEDEGDYPAELDVSITFSLLFTVDGYRGLHRMIFESGDHWISHSRGCKGDRWDI